jgi:hypothetical protein
MQILPTHFTDKGVTFRIGFLSHNGWVADGEVCITNTATGKEVVMPLVRLYAHLSRIEAAQHKTETVKGVKE